MANRAWGFWTRAKLDLLSEYLPAFTKASKRSPETVYLDLFSGDADNRSRETGQHLAGSARIALQTEPPFSKVRLFELGNRALRLQAKLEYDFPGRDVKAYAGDCNLTIDTALAELQNVRWAPTFAFIDPYAAEIRWSTLQKLSLHRPRTERQTKVELWLLFAHAQLPRGLRVHGNERDLAFEAKTDALFGGTTWRAAYEGRRSNLVSAAEFREELANLMRWQLEHELGYEHTMALELKNTSGTPIYTMIFATDHEAGLRIMTHLYRKTAEQFPRMQAEAVAIREQRRQSEQGRDGLFDVPAVVRPASAGPLYEQRPPHPPLQWSDLDGREELSAATVRAEDAEASAAQHWLEYDDADDA